MASSETPAQEVGPAGPSSIQKKVPEQIAEIKAPHPEKTIVVFFQDECRFGQQGTLTRKWAKRGSRPTAVRQTEYNSLGVIAAASPQTGQAEAILSPVLNTEILNQFLDQFSRSLAADVQAVMIWDGAGFHTSHDLQVPSNVTLIKLPPYSPELNGIENLWHDLRSHFWSNRTYADNDDLFEVAESTWCKNCLNPELIKSVRAKSDTHTRSELLGSV